VNANRVFQWPLSVNPMAPLPPANKPAASSWQPMSSIEKGDFLRDAKIVQQPGEKHHEGDS
jgi:hypothetical protein